MTGETHELAWVLPVAVQVILPILAIIGTWMAGKIKAKNERIKQDQDHALALAAQQADFDGRKREAAVARDNHLYETLQQTIDQLQENQSSAAQDRDRMDRKFDQLYESLGYERSHSLDWEEWYRNGMPDPPGKPKRRHLAPTPTT